MTVRSEPASTGGGAVASGSRPLVVAVEEHYWDGEIAKQFGTVEGRGGKREDVLTKLEEIGERRIKDMDANGIDIQVISHGPPGTQKLPSELAVKLTRQANDTLHRAIGAYPNRFAGLANLPTTDGTAAADELTRAVESLGFRGAVVHGLTEHGFLDQKRFFPLFERAAALDAPIYLHPSRPHPAVTEAYYSDYAAKFPTLTGAAWGFGVEAGTQVIRLVLSGALDAFPGLKFVIGHLGEGLPFQLWRIDHALSRRNQLTTPFRKTFMEHFYITTSGFFSDPALRCSIEEMGVERILFAVDWPFVANEPAMEWINNFPLGKEDKAKILSGNAKKLFNL